MKSFLIELDDELAGRLERVAPARSRRRSEFVRAAILKALWEAEEQATAEAYARQPDSPDAAFDAAVWGAAASEVGKASTPAKRSRAGAGVIGDLSGAAGSPQMELTRFRGLVILRDKEFHDGKR